MIRSLAAVVAAAALSTALPAAAQTSPGPGLAISDVGAWITSKGGVVEPAQRQGDEVWLTVRDGDLTWLVFFYGCQNDVCADLQYSASFSNEAITPEMINDWNRDRRFLKAFHAPGAAGQPATAVVQYDLLLQPGGVDQLNDPTGMWVALLQEFARHVGYLPAAAEAAPAQ
jgi:hypothetical protein